MYRWLYFHLIYLFISFVLALGVFFVYYQMNSKLTLKEKDPKKKSNQVKDE